MVRGPRIAPGGIVYHAMNRGVFGLMPNHFHFVLWPRADGDLSAFMHWPTLLLDDWPGEALRDRLARVNRAEDATELEALRRCAARGQPYGDATWVSRTAEQLGLSLRPVGRPRKGEEADGK